MEKSSIYLIIHERWETDWHEENIVEAWTDKEQAKKRTQELNEPIEGHKNKLYKETTPLTPEIFASLLRQQPEKYSVHSLQGLNSFREKKREGGEPNEKFTMETISLNSTHQPVYMGNYKD